MKNLFLFIAVFYIITRTSYGHSIPLLHNVFVSNVVDPNHHEIEELSNFLAFPSIFENNPKWSLISHMGLVVNYSMIFSSEPDDITTIRALDLEHYPLDYFRNLVKKHTTNKTKGASLKGLRKALEISTNPSIIFIATNTEPEDIELLNEILTTMEKKLNPVIVFQIDKNASIPRRTASAMEMNFEEAVVQKIFNQVHEPWAKEYHLIAKASESALYGLVAKVFADLYKPLDVKTEELKGSFQDGADEKTSTYFVYGAINATENDLNQISNSIETYFQSPHNNSSHYSIVFSSQKTTYNMKISENYTAKNFREIIKIQTNDFPKSWSLQNLLITLETIPPSSRIIYYANDEPEDKYEILPQIVQVMIDKVIEISIYGCGNSSGHQLPVVYRTISDANKFTRFQSRNQMSESGNNFLPESDE